MGLTPTEAKALLAIGLTDVVGLIDAFATKVNANASIVAGTATKISYDEKGLITVGAAATTADIPDTALRRYVTEAELTAIGTIPLKAPLASPTFTGTVGGITKAMVGLGDVDNTADLFKPVSMAMEAELYLKAPLDSPTFTGTVAGITKTMVGLADVDNTSDAGKPISTATQAALDLKAPLASPALTGTPTAPTAAVDTNTTQVASCAFVLGQAASVNPLMDGSVAVGTSLRFARQDHVHPVDTSRSPVAGPGGAQAFTVGALTAASVYSTGSVGIGISTPGANLHIKSSSSGAADYSGACLIIERGSSPMVQFKSANTQIAGIIWGDPEDNDVGRLQYDHVNDTFHFWTAGVDRVQIDSTGALIASKNGGGSIITAARNATQYISLGSYVANNVTSYSDPALAKTLALNSTTDTSNTAVSGGTIGIEFQMRGSKVAFVDSGGTWILGPGTPDASGAKFQVDGGVRFRPAASATPITNGDLIFEATSNTSLKLKLKGTDGTVRAVTLTLA